MPSKQSLRAQYRAQRAALGEIADRGERSGDLIAQLTELLTRHNEVRRLGAYMPLPDEPDLTPWLSHLVAEGYEVYLPRVMGEVMHFHLWEVSQALERSGSFGIQEPRSDAPRIPAEALDLIIVPAIAFDARHYRLGRGKGYYDRYLPQTTALTVGVTLGLMPLERLPEDPWDRPMDLVLRPTAAPILTITD